MSLPLQDRGLTVDDSYLMSEHETLHGDEFVPGFHARVGEILEV